MATTTNYAWTTPDNSGLVKNGAQDIRTLGSAVDTALWNVGYGQAGKNKIINGDFTINQRGFTTSTAGGQFVADRFVADNDPANGTVTKTLSAFTPGAAPVAGYEATNYFSIQTTGQSGAQTFSYIFQNVEDVRTFAGQTVTFSFWAKAASGTPKISLENRQSFGSGGSSPVNTNLGFVTLSTSWVRYSVTGTVPSVSGKTIGAGSFSRFTAWVSASTDYSARTNSIGIQSNTFDIWGVQVEAGSIATPFQTATGTLQGELAACQRYYTRFTGAASTAVLAINGYAGTTTVVIFNLLLPVQMRAAAFALDFNNLAFYNSRTGATLSGGTFARWQSYPSTVQLRYTHGSAVFAINDLIDIVGAASAETYIGLSAEL
jgi:hypothetical protein